jgi:hypothetical protein
MVQHPLPVIGIENINFPIASQTCQAAPRRLPIRNPSERPADFILLKRDIGSATCPEAGRPLGAVRGIGFLAPSPKSTRTYRDSQCSMQSIFDDRRAQITGPMEQNLRGCRGTLLLRVSISTTKRMPPGKLASEPRKGRIPPQTPNDATMRQFVVLCLFYHRRPDPVHEGESMPP